MSAYSLSSSFRLAGVPASVPRARHGVRAFLEPAGIDGSKIELAVTEAVSNAVRHGYRSLSGWVEVELGVDDHAVEVVVRDHGVGLLPHPESEGLRVGLLMMRSLADRFELEGEAEVGTTVRMTFALRHVGSPRALSLTSEPAPHVPSATA
jgi:anti-sigma regulatory factor (Ser/Thr protein kinase)